MRQAGLGPVHRQGPPPRLPTVQLDGARRAATKKPGVVWRPHPEIPTNENPQPGLVVAKRQTVAAATQPLVGRVVHALAQEVNTAVAKDELGSLRMAGLKPEG